MRESSRCAWHSVAGIHAVGATSVSRRRPESWVVENRVMPACAEQYVTVQDRVKDALEALQGALLLANALR